MHQSVHTPIRWPLLSLFFTLKIPLSTVFNVKLKNWEKPGDKAIGNTSKIENDHVHKYLTVDDGIHDDHFFFYLLSNFPFTATAGVSPVKKLKPADSASSPPPPVPPGKIIGMLIWFTRTSILDC